MLCDGAMPGRRQPPVHVSRCGGSLGGVFDHVGIAVSDLAAPEPRPQYGATYYGAFLLDPDGNSVEAVHGEREDAVPDGHIDHLWIRVRDPQASRRFYATIAPHAGLRVAHEEPGRVQLSGAD